MEDPCRNVGFFYYISLRIRCISLTYLTGLDFLEINEIRVGYALKTIFLRKFFLRAHIQVRRKKQQYINI